MLPTAAAGLSNEDIVRLYLDVDSESVGTADEKTKKLSATYAQIKGEADQLERELNALGDSFKKGNINLDQYQKSSESLVKNLHEKREVLGQVHGATKNFGQGILGASFAVQDFTSQLGTRGLAGALGAIQNNIPQILSGFGAGAGMAGVASLAAVSVGLLYENWDKIAKLWKGEDVAGQAKELADQLEKIGKEADRLVEVQSKSSKATAERVSAAIGERGGGVIEGQIDLALGQTTELESYITEEDQEAWGRLKRGVAFGNPHEVREGILNRARENRQKQAHMMLGSLPTDRGSRDALRAMANKAPGVFGRGFLTELNMAEPEAQAAMRQEIQAEEMAGKEMQTTRDKMKEKIKARKEKDKLSDQLTDEGRQIEAQMWADRDREREHDKAKAKHDREKAARENTPQAINRRQQEAEEAQALRAVQQNTHGFSGDQQAMIAKHLQGNHEAGLDMSASFEQALAYAIRQTRVQIAQGIAAGLHRQQMQGESRIGP